MKKFSFIVLIIAMFLGACSKKLAPETNMGDEETFDSDLEYYHYFTEATKHTLFGNYKMAIAIFNRCLELKPNSPAVFYQLSNIYMRAGDNDSALEYAEKAYNGDKENKWYALNLANLYQFEKDLDKTIGVYENLVRITNDDEYKYNLAVLYTQNKQYDKALTIGNELEAEHKGIKEVYLLRHNIFDKQNKRDSAVYELESLVQSDPESFENYGLLAEYLAEINRYDYAQEVYQKAVRLNPENSLINLSYAEFLVTRKSDIDSAFYYYRKVVDAEDIRNDEKVSIIYSLLNNEQVRTQDSTALESLIEYYSHVYPNDSKIYTLKADYYIKSAIYPKALDAINNFIALDTTNEFVWEQKLLLENFLSLNDELLVSATTVVRQFPDNAKFWLMKGLAEFSLSLYDSAIGSSTHGLAVSQNNDEKVQFFNLLADCYRVQEQFSLSDKYYEQILAIEPDNLMIRNNYSYYLSVRGERLDYAEELSRLTIQTEPNNATYLDTYGWILFKRGKYKEAKEYVQSAIRYGANQNAEVLEHYGDIMMALDQCADALEAYKMALEVDPNNDVLKEKIERTQTTCEE